MNQNNNQSKAFTKKKKRKIQYKYVALTQVCCCIAMAIISLLLNPIRNVQLVQHYNALITNIYISVFAFLIFTIW